jgi:aspartate/methionine/tyrosine aminotransferase
MKIHDNLITCAPVHSQWAALATFEVYDEWTQKIKKELQKRRDYVINQLKNLEEFLDFHIPEAAYFVFPKFKYTDDDYKECVNILKKVKLAVVPGS